MFGKTANRQSGRQQEVRITTFIVILSAVVLNILWWAGVRFISTDSSNNMTINSSIPVEHYDIVPVK